MIHKCVADSDAIPNLFKESLHKDNVVLEFCSCSDGVEGDTTSGVDCVLMLSGQIGKENLESLIGFVVDHNLVVLGQSMAREIDQLHSNNISGNVREINGIHSITKDEVGKVVDQAARTDKKKISTFSDFIGGDLWPRKGLERGVFVIELVNFDKVSFSERLLRKLK